MMAVLIVFIKIIGIIFLIHIGILLLQFAIAGGLSGKNPLRLLWNMLPDIWMVAHNGTTKPATSSDTSF